VLVARSIASLVFGIVTASNKVIAFVNAIGVALSVRIVVTAVLVSERRRLILLHHIR